MPTLRGGGRPHRVSETVTQKADSLQERCAALPPLVFKPRTFLARKLWWKQRQSSSVLAQGKGKFLQLSATFSPFLLVHP